MNQNLDIFSSAILYRLNVKKKWNEKNETYAENFLSEQWKEVKKLKAQRQPMASRKTFPKWPLTLTEGMELGLLCDVTVVLKIATFLRQWVVRGEGFGSKYKPYFTCEMAEVLAQCSAGIIRLFFVVLCPIAGLQRFIVKLRIVGIASFLSTSWRSLKEGPSKLLTARFCSKLSSVKCSAQTRNCFEDVKYSLFIFISHSLLNFGSWVSLLESANFGFWVVFLWSSLWTWNQNSFKFAAFLELTNSDVTTFIFDNYPTIYPTAPRLWRLENSDFNIPISQQCFVQFV